MPFSSSLRSSRYGGGCVSLLVITLWIDEVDCRRCAGSDAGTGDGEGEVEDEAW